MDPIYTFGYKLAELTHQKEFAGIGLLCLAIKDSGREFTNLGYDDFKQVFLNQLPKFVWVFVFLAKVYGFMFLYYWVRATLPRYRYDQLMRLGWKVFLPLTLLNVVVTGLVVTLAK